MSRPVHHVSSGTVQYDRRLHTVGDVVVRSIAEWREPSGIIARDLYLDGADILQCVSGGFRFVLDGTKAVNLEPGEALVVYPQHRMTCEALGNDNRLVSVVLCGTSVKDYLDAIGFYHGQHGRTTLQVELLAKICKILNQLLADPSAEDPTCMSLMTDVLQSMVQDFREQENSFIYDAIRQIRVNLECGVVRLEPLCEQLHVSRAHLHAAFVSGPMCDSTKDVWKICKGLYKSREKNVDTVASSKSAKDAASIAPDESVCVSVEDEFENLTDEDLNLLLQKMTDLAVEVDLRPELEKVYETYGADQEIFKQEINDELKRRKMSR